MYRFVIGLFFISLQNCAFLGITPEKIIIHHLTCYSGGKVALERDVTYLQTSTRTSMKIFRDELAHPAIYATDLPCSFYIKEVK